MLFVCIALGAALTPGHMLCRSAAHCMHVQLTDSDSACLRGALRACAQGEARRLRAANGELSARLETAQQRLELAVARAAAPAPPAAAAAAAELAQQGTAGPQLPAAPDARQGRARRQLFMQSAPSTPAQAPQRPLLRAPPGAVCMGACASCRLQAQQTPSIAACMPVQSVTVLGPVRTQNSVGSLAFCAAVRLYNLLLCVHMCCRGAQEERAGLVRGPAAAAAQPLAALRAARAAHLAGMAERGSLQQIADGVPCTVTRASVVLYACGREDSDNGSMLLACS
jgi:hypothetical protein